MDWNLTITLATLIIAFCSLLDWLISRSEEKIAKTHLAEWFIRLDDYDFKSAIINFHHLFNHLFDLIYGSRVRSWRFFFTSVISSYFAIAFVTVFFLVTGHFRSGLYVDQIAAMIGISLFVNVWVDVLSLIETRWILKIALGKNILSLLSLLILDLVLSALLFLVPFYLLSSIGDGFYPTNEFLRDLSPFNYRGDEHIPVMLLSSFFTSFIFYLFMMVSLLAWVLGIAKSRLLVIMGKLDESNNLFKSIGAFLTAILGLIKGIIEVFK